EHHDGTRNDEKHSCRQSAFDAVEFPPDISRELLRLRPGEEVTEIERVEIIILGNPAAFLNNLLVHQRDLASGAAKAGEADDRERAGEGGEGGRG
ncbi:MAG: hypothetical protein RLZZ366_1026, partial [Pseudomonadota bacterium]